MFWFGHLTIVLPCFTFSQVLMVHWRQTWMAEGSLGGCVAGVVVIADFLELRDRCLVSLLSIVPVIGGTSMVINLRQDYALPPSCLWPESGSHIVPPWLIDCGRI